MFKILIVDDEPLIRKGIVSLVNYNELNISQVFEASNGKEALEVFEQKLPDMILADINMPKMNGLEFAARAKAMKPNVKIAIITGYDYFDYVQKALKNGVDDYILKPVSKADIKEAIMKLINKIENERSHYEVLSLMQDLKEEIPNHQPEYKKSMDEIIEKNISNSQFSLSFLGDKMGLSTGYLSALFKQIYGVTFQEYILNKRLDKAKILLLSSNRKVYEIAALVGFEDPNYLSATFKKKLGYSPNQYKEKVRNANEEI
jgi:two-component system response regulator YesN